MLFEERFREDVWGGSSNEEEKAARVAEVLGYLMFPDGVCNMITTLFFFMPLKKRFGEIACISVAGVINFAVIASFGFVNNLWVLAALMCIKGCCGAFMLPVAAPLAARYSMSIYPDRAGQVQSIPAMGISLGATLGQSVVVEFKRWSGNTDTRWAWVLSASCILIGVFLTCTAIKLIDAAIEQHAPEQKLTKAQTNVSLARDLPKGLTFTEAAYLTDEREAIVDPIGLSFASTSLANRSFITQPGGGVQRRGRSRAGTAFSRATPFSKFTRGDQSHDIGGEVEL